MTLPNRIFLTGVPGSRWSGIAQTLESMPGFNISDRTTAREYTHNQFAGHTGAYFGTGMELDPILDSAHIDGAWTEHVGTKIVKSHEWAYQLSSIKQQFPNDWIMLVYRPDMPSYAWWHQAGGFDIKYPCYNWYQNSSVMLGKIAEQNQLILEYAHSHNATWNYFTSEWIAENFNYTKEINKSWSDILVTLLR
jgi:hypothetical protein